MYAKDLVGPFRPHHACHCHPDEQVAEWRWVQGVGVIDNSCGWPPATLGFVLSLIALMFFLPVSLIPSVAVMEPLPAAR